MLTNEWTRIRILLLTILATILVGQASGQTFKVLHSFGYNDGQWSEGGQVFDSQGNLYGVTEIGPTGNGCLGDSGCGTVYQLKPNPDGTWTESVIHAFDGSDTAFPLAAPIIDPQGNLYGSADGHAGAGQYPDVIYQLTPGSGGTWTESILYQFSDPPNSEPREVTLDAAGNLYGATAGGGFHGTGSIFSLNRSSGWQEQLLLSFDGYPNGGGAGPEGVITVDTNGVLYGATILGGTYNSGVVYKLTNRGSIFWHETVLYTFAGGRDGDSPNGVIFGPDGSLYGVTQVGGNLSTAYCFLGCGTVFKLTPNPDGTWTKTTVYAFKGGPHDGAFPVDRLIFDRAGNIYSTTGGGGLNTVCFNGCGTVFKLTPSSGGGWTESILHFFTGGLDGSYPIGTIAIDAAGNLYGTAYMGGLNGDGVAYEITP